MEIPAAEELIAIARRRVGPTADDLDLAMTLRQRYGLRTTQSSISRWRGSPRGPSYEATIALLDVAGWLKTDRLAAARDAAEGSRPGAERATERIRDRRRSPAREETGT